MYVRAECSECMGYTTRIVHTSELCAALLEASETFPAVRYPFARNVKRWKLTYWIVGSRWSRARQERFNDLVALASMGDGHTRSGMLSHGMVDSEIAEHPVLRRILSYVLDTSGNRDHLYSVGDSSLVGL